VSSASESQRNVKGSFVELQATCSGKCPCQLCAIQIDLILVHPATILPLLGRTTQDIEDTGVTADDLDDTKRYFKVKQIIPAVWVEQ
jgi:hypothetical protein